MKTPLFTCGVPQFGTRISKQALSNPRLSLFAGFFAACVSFQNNVEAYNASIEVDARSKRSIEGHVNLDRGKYFNVWGIPSKFEQTVVNKIENENWAFAKMLAKHGSLKEDPNNPGYANPNKIDEGDGVTAAINLGDDYTAYDYFHASERYPDYMTRDDRLIEHNGKWIETAIKENRYDATAQLIVEHFNFIKNAGGILPRWFAPIEEMNWDHEWG